MGFRFQTWQVYKDTREFRKQISEILKTFPKTEQYQLIDQTRRAVLSVLLQLAEGSERKTEKDKNVYFNRSLTSIFEVVACIDASLDDEYITKKQHETLILNAENIAKQLRGLEKYTKNHQQ